MNVTTISSPPKPEETSWHEEDSNQGWNETMFLSTESIFDDIWFEIPVDVAHIDYDPDDTSDNDAEEYDS
jgi:hypothetical protein